MDSKPDRTAIVWGVVLAMVLALGAGCWNGSVRNYSGGPGRFALVIEANRTTVEGSHFLLDTLTGDVWRMDAPDGENGSWVQLGTGPEDVRDLEAEEDAPEDT